MFFNIQKYFSELIHPGGRKHILLCRPVYLQTSLFSFGTHFIQMLKERDVIHVCLESSGSISGSWVEIKRVCRFDAGWTIKSSESPSTRGMGLPGHSTTGLEAGAKTKMTHNRRPRSSTHRSLFSWAPKGKRKHTKRTKNKLKSC